MAHLATTPSQDWLAASKSETDPNLPRYARGAWDQLINGSTDHLPQGSERNWTVRDRATPR